MFTLANLSPTKGSNRPRKRLGRGPGSGTGKTCGRGHNGQRSRKSGNLRPGFEGGQTPFYRRVPKRGFSGKRNKVSYTLCSLDDLNKFSDDSVVDLQSYYKFKLLDHNSDQIKILANGTLKRKLTVHAHKFSRSSVAAIEQLGGKVVFLQSIQTAVKFKKSQDSSKSSKDDNSDNSYDDKNQGNEKIKKTEDKTDISIELTNTIKDKDKIDRTHHEIEKNTDTQQVDTDTNNTVSDSNNTFSSNNTNSESNDSYQSIDNSTSDDVYNPSDSDDQIDETEQVDSDNQDKDQ